MNDRNLDLEKMQLNEIFSVQEKKFKAQIGYLFDESDFYRSKYKTAGVDRVVVSDLVNLRELPFTTKDEIRTSLDSGFLGKHLAVKDSNVVQVHASSGTTGKPSYVGLTQEDLKDWTDIIGRALIICGIRKDDLVVQAFGMSRGWVGGLPIVQGLLKIGAGVIPIGAEPGTRWLLTIIRDLKPVAIVGTPNFLIYLAEQSEEILGVPAKSLGVRLLVTGGEPGGGVPSIRSRAQELWGAKMYELMGGTDICPVLWAECEDQSGMHFVAPDLVYAELVGLENQEHVPFEKGNIGELVYSHLQREANPLMRFRHGDIVEVLDTKCKCGRTGPKIRCFGRTDDMFIVKGVNVYPTAIQDIVMNLRPSTTGVVRIVKESADYSISGPLIIKVERGYDRSFESDSDLVVEIENLVSEICKCRVKVTVVSAGTYPAPGREKVSLVEKSYS